ncbi:alpha/beta hydrolase [Halorubellus litoreus]|uniref:Alpha/beta fold hydrolase n=1 Tax=Halorubellus litoreus TaxID=755308 RepID=A0ABD5V8G5_9EURY
MTPPDADQTRDAVDADPTPDPFRGEDGAPVVPDGWTHGVVDANGITVSYYRVGPAPEDASATVVVAHGFFEDARCKRRLVNALADEYDVVAYDARGHGHTDATETGYAPADRVADLVGVLDALDLDDPVLYGHSMGGSTVAKTAADHPDRVAGVVMEDPAGTRSMADLDVDEIADGIVEDVREELAMSFDELLATYEDPDDEDAASAVDEIPPELYATFARSDQRQSEHVAEIPRQGYPALAEVFPEVAVPALVLRRDHATVPDPIRDGSPTDERVRDLDLADSLPDGRLVHVPGAGHHVVLTAEDAALAEVRAFLARLDDGE